MSFKKTVTFSASVSDYTDGTVTARVQAENNILGQFVTWLLAQNNSITQIEKVEIGDSEWSGYPMYAVQSGTPSAVSVFFNGYSLLSDVYILGKNKNNFLMGVCVDNHTLRVSPTCSFEYQDYLNTASSQPVSILATQLRSAVNTSENNRTQYGGSLSMFTFSTAENELSLTINYWKGTDALVLSVSGKRERLFFSFGNEDESFGYLSSYSNYKPLVNYSFNEVMQANISTQTLTSESSDSVTDCLAMGYATNANPYFWGRMNSGYSNYTSSYIPVAVRMHIMNTSDGDISSIANDYFIDNKMETDNTRIVCGKTLYNLPRITREQIYLRKMYIPNRQTSSPIKLGYTPGNLYADAIYKVNNKYYVCLKDGWCSYFVEVEDQD